MTYHSVLTNHFLVPFLGFSYSSFDLSSYEKRFSRITNNDSPEKRTTITNDRWLQLTLLVVNSVIRIIYIYDVFCRVIRLLMERFLHSTNCRNLLINSTLCMGDYQIPRPGFIFIDNLIDFRYAPWRCASVPFFSETLSSHYHLFGTVLGVNWKQAICLASTHKA